MQIAEIRARKYEWINPGAVLSICYNNIPGCTHFESQIASVGYTEEQAKEEGYDIKVGKFPFSASGKATGLGHEERLTKSCSMRNTASDWAVI